MRTGLALCVLLTVGGAAAGQNSASGPALPRAHAHNDYWHKRPLLDALDHGFCSVEADVLLVDGRLMVGHGRSEISPARKLETLYLEPLKARIAANGGHVYPEPVPFTLMIDIKSDGAATYRVLSRLLRRYAGMLTKVEAGRIVAGPVTIVLSGNRATELIGAQPVRYALIDGRLSDLNSDQPPSLIYWISDRWTSHFHWRGEGEMPDGERRKLRDIVARAHRAGRRVRFWATPDRAAMWRELYQAGVDWINTDDLNGLRTFLLEQRKKQKRIALQFEAEDRLPDVRVDGKPVRIHTQGLYATRRYYYVTGRLEGRSRRPLLVRFDRSDGNRIESIDLARALGESDATASNLDHPGGFDFDGRRFWIPVSESRPNGKTIVLTYQPAGDRALSIRQAVMAFGVDDHIGALAYDQTAQVVYGANWDTRRVYCWNPDGTLVRKIDAEALNAQPPGPRLAVQDWKSLGRGVVLASGIDKSPLRPIGQVAAVLAEIDLRAGTYRAFERLGPPAGLAGPVTREGMAVQGDSVYFLPSDLGSGAAVYRYRRRAGPGR